MSWLNHTSNPNFKHYPQVLNASVTASVAHPSPARHGSVNSSAPFALLDLPTLTAAASTDGQKSVPELVGEAPETKLFAADMTINMTASAPSLPSEGFIDSGVLRRRHRKGTVDLEARVRELLGQKDQIGNVWRDDVSHREPSALPAAKETAVSAAARIKEKAAAEMLATWEQETAAAIAQGRQDRFAALEAEAAGAAAAAAAAVCERNEAVAAALAAQKRQTELEQQILSFKRKEEEGSAAISAAYGREFDLERRLEEMERKLHNQQKLAASAEAAPAAATIDAATAASARERQAALERQLQEAERDCRLAQDAAAAATAAAAAAAAGAFASSAAAAVNYGRDGLAVAHRGAAMVETGVALPPEASQVTPEAESCQQLWCSESRSFTRTAGMR